MIVVVLMTTALVAFPFHPFNERGSIIPRRNVCGFEVLTTQHWAPSKSSSPPDTLRSGLRPVDHDSLQPHGIVLQYIEFSNAYACLTKVEGNFRMLCSSMPQVDDRNLVAVVSAFC